MIKFAIGNVLEFRFSTMSFYEKDKRHKIKSKSILFFIFLSLLANYPYSYIYLSLILNAVAFVSLVLCAHGGGRRTALIYLPGLPFASTT